MHRGFALFAVAQRLLLLLPLVVLMSDGVVAPEHARRPRVEDVQWNDEEKAMMTRAERLRWYGRRVEAENMVAEHVEVPSIVTRANVHLALSLDVSRWYAAQTGKHWDGRAETFVEARNLATRRRHTPGQPKPFERAEDTLRMYRSAHLLVEPFARGQASVELQDYTRYVGWPTLHSCGRLEHDLPDGRSCCYCEALLFEQESVHAAGTTERCGKNCCMQGCAFPSRWLVAAMHCVMLWLCNLLTGKFIQSLWTCGLFGCEICGSDL